MKKMMLFVVCIFCVAAGFAVLPPYYQSSKELKKILNDDRTAEFLGSGQQILEIKRVEGGWVIITPKYELDIDVLYEPSQQQVGPAVFSLFYHEPIELSK